MYIRREIEGSDSKVTAKVVAYLPTTAADPYIVDGTPRELWRVKYMGSSALRGDTEDLEEHELESSEPSWSWAAYKHKDADDAADLDEDSSDADFEPSPKRPKKRVRRRAVAKAVKETMG